MKFYYFVWFINTVFFANVFLYNSNNINEIFNVKVFKKIPSNKEIGCHLYIRTLIMK